MRIALIIPDSPFLLDPLGFPPLGPLYVSASLKRAGYSPEVYDLTGTAKLDVPKLKADVIGISASTPQFSYAVRIMENLRGRNPDATFVIGGPHAIVSPETCRRAGFDLVVAGEGEEAMVNFVRRYEQGYRPNEDVVRPDPVNPLDKLPYPDREAVELDRYHYYIAGERATSVMTQRGCPYKCAFCCGRGIPAYSLARFHSPGYVAGELRHVMDRYGIRAFMFYDDEFNLNKRRTLELCERIKDLDIVWRCMIRSDLFDEELAEAMAESGCIEVGCGVETGSERIKRIVGKGTTLEQDLNAVRLCHRYGIKFKCFIIVGLPGENRDTFNETREWLRKAQPDNYDFTIFMPYPGSPIWEHPECYDIRFGKEEIVRSNFGETWFKGVMGGPSGSLVSTSALSGEEIMRLRLELEEEFRRMSSSPWSGTEKLK